MSLNLCCGLMLKYETTERSRRAWNIAVEFLKVVEEYVEKPDNFYFRFGYYGVDKSVLRKRIRSGLNLVDYVDGDVPGGRAGDMRGHGDAIGGHCLNLVCDGERILINLDNVNKCRKYLGLGVFGSMPVKSESVVIAPALDGDVGGVGEHVDLTGEGELVWGDVPETYLPRVSKLSECGFRDRRAVRIRVEFDDGEVREAVGDDAGKIMEHWNGLETFAWVHGQRYCGPCLKVVVGGE